MLYDSFPQLTAGLPRYHTQINPSSSFFVGVQGRSWEQGYWFISAYCIVGNFSIILAFAEMPPDPSEKIYMGFFTECVML